MRRMLSMLAVLGLLALLFTPALVAAFTLGAAWVARWLRDRLISGNPMSPFQLGRTGSSRRAASRLISACNSTPSAAKSPSLSARISLSEKSVRTGRDDSRVSMES